MDIITNLGKKHVQNSNFHWNFMSQTISLTISVAFRSVLSRFPRLFSARKPEVETPVFPGNYIFIQTAATFVVEFWSCRTDTNRCGSTDTSFRLKNTLCSWTGMQILDTAAYFVMSSLHSAAKLVIVPDWICNKTRPCSSLPYALLNFNNVANYVICRWYDFNQFSIQTFDVQFIPIWKMTETKLVTFLMVLKQRYMQVFVIFVIPSLIKLHFLQIN